MQRELPGHSSSLLRRGVAARPALLIALCAFLGVGEEVSSQFPRAPRRRLIHGVSSQGLQFERSAQEFAVMETFEAGVADFDNDGFPDAFLANMGLHDSQVFLNDGHGWLWSSGQTLTQQGHGVALGDLDGDGDFDAFVVCAGTQPGPGQPMRMKPSMVYLNDGSGSFHGSGQDFGDAELSGNFAFLLEADGDDDLDVLVHYYFGADRIFLNDGHGVFVPSDALPPEGCMPADLDGDGLDDLFCTEAGVGYRVLLNDASGHFVSRWEMSGQPGSSPWVAFGDVNADGFLDVVSASGDPERNEPTLVLFNDGTGRLRASGQALKALQWSRIALGDVNDDGTLDAVLTNFDQPAEVWLNNGRGWFFDSGIRLPADGWTVNCVLADFDADRRLDVFLSVLSPGANTLWFNRSAVSR